MEWSVTEFKESHTDICGQTLLWRWHSSCFQSHLDFLEAGGWTQQIKYLHKNESNAYLKNCRCCDYYGIPDLECENLSLWSEASLTSFRFCNKSSNLSLALFAMTLFLSASYWRCVLSMLMLRFRATLTKAVISFMAGKEDKRSSERSPGGGGACEAKCSKVTKGYLQVCSYAWMLWPGSQTGRWAERWPCPSCTHHRWCCTDSDGPERQ